MAEAKRIGPKKLGPKHKAIAQWMIANPMANYGQIAATFGVSAGWVSTIVRSDAFQHYLRELDEEIAEQIIVPLRGRLLGVSELALQKLGLAVANSQDPKFLLDVADKTLHRLGYAPTRGPAVPPGQVNVQNNVYVADSEALRIAREKFGAEGPTTSSPTVEGTTRGGLDGPRDE